MQSNKAFQLRFLSLMVTAMCAGAAQAQLAPGALPTGATVVGGQASIVQNGSTLHIHQTSAQALVNFSGFNVGSAALVDIRQPGAAAALLARVTGNDPSQIQGQIRADGALWLINPAGIMVGQGARIDVGSFIASTLNVSDADFLAGRLNFTADGNAASVRNAGAITAGAAGGGRIYLVGGQVQNSGSLNAPGGEVLLAAGRNVQLVDTGTPGVSIALSGAGGDVTNLGRIVAEAGRIGLGGALVANAGEISASSAVREGGRVFLRAAALKTDASSDIHANGTSGGQVVLAADRADIDGRISATGSAGPGGFVDTSGHASLNVRHAPTVGKGGEWLIDPSNLEVVAGAGGGASVEDGSIVSTENGTTIGADVITAQLNQGASVTLATGSEGAGLGNIVVNAAIAKTSDHEAQLTLRAHNDIAINAPITSTGPALHLSLKNNFHGNPDDAGHAATLNADLDLNGGRLEVSQGEALGNGTLNIVGGTARLDGGATIDAAAVNVGANGRLSIGNTQWVQSQWTNDGAIEVRDETGSLSVSGSLVNNGLITLSGSSYFGIAGAGVANNGTIRKTSQGDQLFENLNLGASSRIEVDAGRLNFVTSTLGGKVAVAADAGVVLDGAKLAGGVEFTGAGSMTWVGGVTLLGDVTLGAGAPDLYNDPTRLTLVRGAGHKLTTHNAIGIEGNFVFDGDMVWNNHGRITVGQQQPGYLAFNTNAVFNNKAGGLLDVQDNSRLELSTQTVINNEAGAVLQVASNGINSFSGGYQGRLVNSGTVIKTGSGSTPATLENLAGGVLRIQEGAFGATFSEANANAGTVEIAAGAALRSTGGVDLHNTGTIRGTGTVELGDEGGRLVNNGRVAPGGSDEVGTLTVNGGYTQGAQGALDIRLSGSSADRLDVNGPVQLAGTLNLSTLGGALPVDGALADFLTGSNVGNAGMFASVNAPAIVTPETTGTLSVVYPAMGTVVAQVKAATAPIVVEPPVVEPPVVTPPVVEPPVVEPPVVEPPVVTPPVVSPPVAPAPAPSPAPAPESALCAYTPDLPMCGGAPSAAPPAPVQQQAQMADVVITNVLAGPSPLAPMTSEIALSVSKGENSATAPVDSTGQANKPAVKNYCN